MERKFISSLMGLAVCDALGTAVEFMPRGSFEEVVSMRGGGKFNLLPGQWTDDTSMALCLCESIVECGGRFDPADQCSRYYRWFQDGHLSSTGECFDIGMTTQKALLSSTRSLDPYCGPTGTKAAGNGCLMRLAPVPLAYWTRPLLALEHAGDSARTTHGASAAIDSCRYYAGLIIGCLHDVDKEQLLSSRYTPPGVPGDYWTAHPLVPEVDAIANGSFKTKTRDQISSSGYIVHSMEAALWALYNTTSFEQGALLAVNLGDDADTVGAIYGQLAGAHYGRVPDEWAELCTFRSLIEQFGRELSLLSAGGELTGKYEVSAKYKEIKTEYFDQLEPEARLILRRSSPCPKQYKTLEEFDSNVQRLLQEYGGDESSVATGNSGRDIILKDYQKQWKKLREKLTLRLGRGRM